jgi:hypothetical protein
MYLRLKVRRKDGKEYRYWSIVENRRVSGGRTVLATRAASERDQYQPVHRVVPDD